MVPSGLVAFVLVSGLSAAASVSRSQCKFLPGDAQWPTDAEWTTLNSTVDGRLIRTVPIGSVCHTGDYFNATDCAAVQSGWGDFTLHTESSSSLMQWYTAEKSCDPFSGPDSPCVVGTYVSYAVDVATKEHIANTVQFAQKHNIRFVVRNTGHDYMSKSTGRGALSIWTHHLKKTEWFEHYKTADYSGPAVTAQSGVQGLQIYTEANTHGLAIVGGYCETVGYAGGYVVGGGQSPLGGFYGLASDQTLSFEVITTTGQFITASPFKNSDLYWALSGGGGGTFAIVWSVTVKAYRDIPITTARVAFNAGGNVSMETWWTAFDFYQSQIPKYNAARMYAISSFSAGSFAMRPSFFPNTTTAEITTLFQPLFDHFILAKMPFESSITTYPHFLEAYLVEKGPTNGFMGGIQIGGRLLTSDLWETDAKFTEMTTTIRSILEDGATVGDIILNPTLEIAGHKAGDNAVLPAWRTNQRLCIPQLTAAANATLEEMQQQRASVGIWGAKLTKLAPNSGSYLNEANVLDPDWKIAFYGTNYARLLSIKQKYDPSGTLYGSTSVGGDLWKVNSEGALCSV